MRQERCKACGKPTTHYNAETAELLCSLCTRHYHIATLRHALDRKTCDRVHGLFTLLELQRGCWDVRDGPEECAHQHVIDAGNGWGRCVDCGDDSFPMASETAELASPSADSWSPSLAHQAPVGAGVMRETCQSCGKPDAPLWREELICEPCAQMLASVELRKGVYPDSVSCCTDLDTGRPLYSRPIRLRGFDSWRTGRPWWVA